MNRYQQFLVSGLFASIGLSTPLNQINSIEKRDKFVWGSLGDTWASGVNYDSSHTNFDENANNCLRGSYSYGAMMSKEAWTENPQEVILANF